MSTHDALERRMARLESFRQAEDSCPTCWNRPVRVVTIDEDTNEEISETMPASGCPMCGRSLFRELRLVGPRHGVFAGGDTR